MELESAHREPRPQGAAGDRFHDLLRIGDWTFHSTEGLLVRGTTERHLRPKAADLLVILASNAGRTVLKETIAARLWPDTAVEGGALNRCISELRAALGDDARAPTYIRTVPHRGYRLVAAVEPSGAKPGSGRGRFGAPAWLWAAAALGVAIGILALLAGPLGSFARRSVTPAAGTLREAPVRRAIVLSFSDLTGTDEKRWLGEAFRHLLTAELAASGELKLVPHDLVRGLDASLSMSDISAPSPEDLRWLRRGLGVDYVIGGHYVAGDGDEAAGIRLDVAVIDSLTGEILTAVVETGSEDRFAEMTTLASRRLRQELGLAAPSRPARPAPPSSAERAVPADYYRGLLRLGRYEAEAARAYLERAIEHQPEAPWPRLALAEAWSELGFDRRAAEVVDTALERAEGLTHEDRLWLEARAHSLAQQWDAAIERLDALCLLEPENLEYGITLAATHLAAGRIEAAQEAVSRAQAGAPADHRDPRLQLIKGESALALGDHPQALAEAEAALELARPLRADAVEGRALLLRARGLYAAGHVAEASSALEAAEERFVRVRDQASQAETLITQARWLINHGEQGPAEEKARTALSISRRIGDRSGEAWALRLLGIWAWQRGRRDEGEAAFGRALELARETADRESEADTLSFAAIAHASYGGHHAGSTFEQALEIYRELGNRQRISSGLQNVGRVAMLSGRIERALEAFSEAETIVDEVDADSRATLLFNLGSSQLLAGDVAGAAASLDEARTLFQQLGNRRMEAAALEGLGAAETMADRPDEAVDLLRESLRLRAALSDPLGEGNAQSALAGALLESGAVDEAEHVARDSLAKLARPSGDYVRVNALGALARIQLESGRVREAVETTDRFPEITFEKATATSVGHRITRVRALAAMGEHDQAERLLADILAYLGTRGAHAVRIEAQLARLEVARWRGERPNAAREHALEQEARQRGLALLARKIRTLE